VGLLALKVPALLKTAPSSRYRAYELASQLTVPWLVKVRASSVSPLPSPPSFMVAPVPRAVEPVPLMTP
jgi:hypothetical protein